METAYTCVKCGALPVEDIKLDFANNRMSYRFYCHSCKLTSDTFADKKQAIKDWNEKNFGRRVLVLN